MASAQANEVFNCLPKEFFALVADFEKYPEFLSEVKKVKIIKNEKNKIEMEWSVSVIKTFSYKLLAELEEPHSVRFHYTSGDVFKTMKGSWKIEPEGTGKTKIQYDVEANFGLLVPGAIAKTLVSVNLPIMMESFKKRVKKIYGK